MDPLQHPQDLTELDLTKASLAQQEDGWSLYGGSGRPVS
jgi:hypothetical protein